MPAPAEGDERVPDPAGRVRRANLGDPEKLQEMLVFRYLAHQAGGGGQPAAGVIVVVFIQIIRDFLKHAVAENRGISVKHDGPHRRVAGRLGKQPLVEDG